VKLLNESLRLAPSLANAHIQLGKLLFAQKKPSEAVEEFGEALAWEPDNALVRALRSEAAKASQ
jgi:tetratricopeptide (TPR) repeat protein